jgi:hypothetical protein
MATVHAGPEVSCPERFVRERRTQRAWRTINGDGWRQRLAPLAEFMGNRRLIRARSDCGAALALLTVAPATGHSLSASC